MNRPNRLNRRDLLRTAAVAGAALSAPFSLVEARQERSGRRLLKPKKLQPGDTVGMVLPASLEFEANELSIGVDNLEALGFRVRVGEHARDRHGYFAGRDLDRAADINAMFADPEVDGVFTYTGGWGSPRLLPHLDYDTIRRNPKVLIGFSDVTALINTIHQRTGLVTFHGPVASSNLEPYSLENLRRVIMNSDPIGTLSNPPKPDNALIQRRYRTYTIRGGRARGPIVGGNLTLLTAVMGTPYEVATDGAILFLEDVREAVYRVDRMLTQLSLGGKLQNVAGVVFGYCTNCPAERSSFSLEQVLRHHLEPLGVPVFAGFAFGHLEQKLTLPIGIEATIDAEAGTVTIDEAAVV